MKFEILTNRLKIFKICTNHISDCISKFQLLMPYTSLVSTGSCDIYTYITGSCDIYTYITGSCDIYTYITGSCDIYMCLCVDHVIYSYLM